MGGSDSIRVRVPGKAILAGEYAVLAGGPAIVCAVGRHLSLEARPSERLVLEGVGSRWEEGEPETPELGFARTAVRAAARYLEGRGVRVEGQSLAFGDALRAPGGQKLGLGGSACTSVAAVAATLASVQAEPARELIFKLAAIAHGAAQGKPGSAVDVAASTWGGTLWTRQFEVEPFLALLEGPAQAFAYLVDRVPAPEVERLPEPPGFTLVFSGTSASTPKLVGEVERFRRGSPAGFAEFMARTCEASDRLRRALSAGQLEGATRALADAGRLLEGLGERAGVAIVTEEHRRIAERAAGHGAAAKISGAGGGDCSVAIGGAEAIGRLRRELEAAGLVVLAPGVDGGGVVIER